MKKFLLAILCVLPLTMAFQSCNAPVDPNAPVPVLTTSDNIKVGTPPAEVVTVPAEQLKGVIGDQIKKVLKPGQTVVVTSSENLAQVPGDVVVHMDARATQDLLSPEVIATITGAVSTIPGWGTWVGAALGILGLLSKNFRNGIFQATDRVIPLIPDLNGQGGLPDHTDLAAAVHDVARAVTLQEPVPPTGTVKVVNG